MGIFDFLFAKAKEGRVEVLPDAIWLTSKAKFEGLAKQAIERSESGSLAVLLVAHFPDVLERLEGIVQNYSWSVPCIAVPADNLSNSLANRLKLDESVRIDIIVGERHPLPSVDDRLESFAAELPCRIRFAHHVSLDDAVLKFFARDWVKEALMRLGIKEDEAIESRLVSTRIRRAQKQIEGRALVAREADSAAEWLTKNCPDLWRS